MIKMIVFDMAGTTVRENNLVYRTLQKTINEAGFPVSLDDVLLHGAGKEKLQAVKDILQFASPGLPDRDERASSLHKQFLTALAHAYEQAEISAFDTCESLFQKLRTRGIKVVLNTGYNRQTADQLLHRLAWVEGQQIDLSVTADQVPNSRPHPDMIHLAMQKMGIQDAYSVAKVGDSIIDIEEGKNAGCGLTFGVTTGAHTAEQLASASPDHVIDSLTEMLALI